VGKNKGKKNLIKKRKFKFSISFILAFLYSFFCGTNKIRKKHMHFHDIGAGV